METGAITSHIDVALVTLYVFWLFFFGLIVYLRREDRREGFPLVYDRPGAPTAPGAPTIPKPKTLLLPNGETRMLPRPEPKGPELKAKPSAPWPGAPLVPTGDPLQDGVGPAAYTKHRIEEPELAIDGTPRCRPMRAAPEFSMDEEGPDPRGYSVRGVDGNIAGTVVEIWVDRSEPKVRYLETEVDDKGAKRRILVPINLACVESGRRSVRVESLTTAQIARTPGIAKPDEVNQREEDRICAYFAGGHLYATAEREEPIL